VTNVPEGIVETNYLDDGGPVPWTDLPFGVRMRLFGLGEPDDPAAPTFVMTRLPANGVLPPHYHESTFVDVVVQGSVKVGGKWYGPGDVRCLAWGVKYGPSEAGPEGVTLLEFYADGRGRRGMHDPAWITDEFEAEVAKFTVTAGDAAQESRERLASMSERESAGWGESTQ
jgi:hypothetical protein